jgi:gamma-glutamyl phosphate reductase
MMVLTIVNRIPVLGHADGICSVYVDIDATDIDKAVKIVVDSKVNQNIMCFKTNNSISFHLDKLSCRL